MKEKYIQLLQEQQDKLEASQFDLEAWKSATTAILTRIFGTGDPKAQFIKNIRVEFGSWSLRDNYGSTNPMGTAIKQCREIVASAIRELELFDLPGASADTSLAPLTEEQRSALRLALQETGSQREAQVRALIEEWEPTLIRQLLTSLLLR